MPFPLGIIGFAAMAAAAVSIASIFKNRNAEGKQREGDPEEGTDREERK